MRKYATAEQKKRFGGEFLAQVILKGIFHILPKEVFSLQDFVRAGVMDVTFFQLARCKKLVSDWEASRDTRLGGIRLRPL